MNENQKQNKPSKFGVIMGSIILLLLLSLFLIIIFSGGFRGGLTILVFIAVIFIAVVSIHR